MIVKKCSKPGCFNHIPRGQRSPYCEAHRKQTNKYYNKHERNQTIAKFYWSATWKKFRANVLKERLHLCEVHKAKGEIVPGDTLHHIIETNTVEGWERRLDRTNVQVVCRACHEAAHVRGVRNI